MQSIGKVGPIAALTLLQLYIEGKLELHGHEVEKLLDDLFDALTELRDETQWRVRYVLTRK